MTMDLRPYQQEAVTASEAIFASTRLFPVPVGRTTQGLVSFVRRCS